LPQGRRRFLPMELVDCLRGKLVHTPEARSSWRCPRPRCPRRCSACRSSPPAPSVRGCANGGRSAGCRKQPWRRKRSLRSGRTSACGTRRGCLESRSVRPIFGSRCSHGQRVCAVDTFISRVEILQFYRHVFATCRNHRHVILRARRIAGC